ncbi:hypothetical protein ABK905_02040 [Acerihabitans sp. KWT182]|uniref:Uncharacterized protein n=1 Tax=Acerihabitans sp. KWT182 TaxID=3157919 RepID=A0AAU7QAK5_9GAMM
MSSDTLNKKVPIEHIISNSDVFDEFIEAIRNGDKNELIIVPHIVEVIKVEQINRLRDALIHSLLISTTDTLNVLKGIDNKINEEGYSSFKDNFGTNSVCAYLINTDQYDRNSFFEYYAKVKLKLLQSGRQGNDCLDLMNSPIAETLYEEKNGRLKWGTETYLF